MKKHAITDGLATVAAGIALAAAVLLFTSMSVAGPDNLSNDITWLNDNSEKSWRADG